MKNWKRCAANTKVLPVRARGIQMEKFLAQYVKAGGSVIVSYNAGLRAIVSRLDEERLKSEIQLARVDGKILLIGRYGTKELSEKIAYEVVCNYIYWFEDSLARGWGVQWKDFPNRWKILCAEEGIPNVWEEGVWAKWKATQSIFS